MQRLENKQAQSPALNEQRKKHNHIKSDKRR
jgi:hypothetical protein